MLGSMYCTLMSLNCKIKFLSVFTYWNESNRLLTSSEYEKDKKQIQYTYMNKNRYYTFIFMYRKSCPNFQRFSCPKFTVNTHKYVINIIDVLQTDFVFNNILIISSKFFLKALHIGQRQFLSNFYLKIHRVSKVRFMRFYY